MPTSNNLINSSNQAKQRINDQSNAVRKEMDTISINREKRGKATKELDELSKGISKMKPSGIDGTKIANSENPYDKLTALIDEVNTFADSASEYKNSLIKVGKNIDKPHNVNVSDELGLNNEAKAKLGLSYVAKEIIITNEQKTKELIEKMAKAYTANNFLKSTPEVGFDFSKMNNAADVAAGFNAVKYNALSLDLQEKFNASLGKIGLKFDAVAGGGGAIVKAKDNNPLTDPELDSIKKDIAASIKLFDVDLSSIYTKLSEVKSALASVVQRFDSAIKSQDEKDNKAITEKEKKVSEYEKKIAKINQDEAMAEDTWKNFDKEMEELDKMFDNMLKSLGLDNSN